VNAYYPKCRTDISYLTKYFGALVCYFISWATGNPATEIEVRLIIAKKSAGIGKAEPIVNPKPFWQTVRADVARLREEDLGLRALVRGIVSQGFQALLVYRIFHWFHEHGIPMQPIRFFIERLIEITTGISIPVQVRIGKGLRIHHFGGIIVHSEAVIGESCTIYHGVTLGDLGGWGGAPRIGNHVVIGAGAKILGQIEIGDYCRIGANAVVRTSVPAGCLAVGVPAVIKQTVAASHEVM
jgi:serine O-acetyltransferase